MSTKQCMCLSVVLFLSVARVVCDAKDEEGKVVVTKKEVVALLPTGPDMIDDSAMSNYTKLVALGPDAYPALSDLLDETEDPIVISRIFAVFVKSKGDKTNAVSAIIKTLERFPGAEQTSITIQIVALDALGSIGSTNDITVVHKLIDSNSERVRINALRAAGRIGNASSIERLESILNKRGANLSKDEKRRDYSFAEGAKAITKIRSRAAAKTKKEGSSSGGVSKEK